MTGPAVRLLREGFGVDGECLRVQRGRRIPTWPLVAGAAVLSLPSSYLGFSSAVAAAAVGIDGLTVALFGMALVTVSLVPRIAAPLIHLLTVARPDVGRLLRADVQRYALLFGMSAAILAAETSLLIGSQSMQLLGASQAASQKAGRLPSSC